LQNSRGYSIPEEISINERINVFLHSLSKGECFSRIMYENFNNKSISEKTAKNDIRLMVEGEWCEMKGKGPSTTYVRTDRKLPDIS
jgi:ATP-dependent DNA helicase RecG